jgi:hypothetical protein
LQDTVYFHRTATLGIFQKFWKVCTSSYRNSVR